MPAIQPQPTITTLKEYEALPEDARAEVFDGQIYYMAPPGTKHQRLVHFFDREIGNYIQQKHGECEVFPAPFADNASPAPPP